MNDINSLSLVLIHPDLFRLAAISSSDHIVISDPDGKIFFANDAACRITGYSQSEMIGHTPSLWGRQMSTNFYKQLWKTIKDEKQPFNGNVRNKRKNGEIYDAILRIAPILNSGQELIGFIATEEDISEQMRIDRAKTEFISFASHQLRSPITAIRWYTEMMLSEDGGIVSERQKHLLNESYSAVLKMNDLVSSFLNVSRIELGTFLIDPKPLNISDIVSQCIAELDSLKAQKNLVVELSFDKTIDTLKADKQLFIIIGRIEKTIEYIKFQSKK